MSSYVSSTIGWFWDFLPKRTEIVIKEIEKMAPIPSSYFMKLAGVSGCLAIAFGAYGAHVFRESGADPQLKLVYETGNKYHIYHSLALLAVPLTNRPRIVGTLLSLGMVLFCGSCYFHAMTGNSSYRRVTPYGGILLMAGWLAMVL